MKKVIVVEIKYLSPTEKRGSRVSYTCKLFSGKRITPYGYYYDSILAQAVAEVPVRIESYSESKNGYILNVSSDDLEILKKWISNR